MTDLLIYSEINRSQRSTHVADRPIDFESWLSLTNGLDTELIKGVMVDRMAAQYPHEWIFAWLFALLQNYTRHRGLGVTLGSRTAVKIDRHNGRLPDILFVRSENTSIIHKDAIYGAPDLIVEIISPNDGRPDVIALESDYFAIGVPEILFIDPQKKHVRIWRMQESGEYADVTLLSGTIELKSVPGFAIDVEWIFAAVQPDVFDLTSKLLREIDADA